MNYNSLTSDKIERNTKNIKCDLIILLWNRKESISVQRRTTVAKAMMGIKEETSGPRWNLNTFLKWYKISIILYL